MTATTTSYQAGYSLHDFESSTKADRIRVKEQDGKLNFKLIDFNGTGDIKDSWEVKNDIYNLVGHYLNIFSHSSTRPNTSYSDSESFENHISTLSDPDKYFALSLYYLHAGLTGDGKKDSPIVMSVIPLLAKYISAQENNDIQGMIDIYRNSEISSSKIGTFLAQSALSISPDNGIIQRDLSRMSSIEESIGGIFRIKVADISQGIAMGYPDSAIKQLSDDFITSEPTEIHRDILSCVRDLLKGDPKSNKFMDIANKLLFINSANNQDIDRFKKTISDLGIKNPQLDRIVGVFESKFEPTKNTDEPVIEIAPVVKKEFNIPLDEQAKYRRIFLRRKDEVQSNEAENQASLVSVKLELEESQNRGRQLESENGVIRATNEEVLSSLSEQTRINAKLQSELSDANHELEVIKVKLLELQLEAESTKLELEELKAAQLQNKGE